MPAVARFAGDAPGRRRALRGARPTSPRRSPSRPAHGLPLAVRSGGHCFAGRSTTEGLVLDARRRCGPSRSTARRATIGAGAPLGDVYEALAAHGRAIPAGCGPTVGAAGLTLGGGLGILGRAHGLTSDALRGAEVVLADGRQVTCARTGSTRTSSGRCAAPAARASAS